MPCLLKRAPRQRKLNNPTAELTSRSQFDSICEQRESIIPDVSHDLWYFPTKQPTVWVPLDALFSCLASKEEKKKQQAPQASTFRIDFFSLSIRRPSTLEENRRRIYEIFIFSLNLDRLCFCYFVIRGKKSCRNNSLLWNLTRQPADNHIDFCALLGFCKLFFHLLFVVW